MSRSWLVLALACYGCDSPQVVSFNTPGVCGVVSGGFLTFTQAMDACGADCVICVESELDERVASYAVSHDEDCVCRPPARVWHPDAGREPLPPSAAADSGGIEGDGGRSNESYDAGRSTNDADSGVVAFPGSDGCRSLLHLSRSEARAQCSAWDDCHVCVERVDLEGDARSYMAHQCGCPDVYRVDPE